jgi:CSLREA domain-containing protein
MIRAKTEGQRVHKVGAIGLVVAALMGLGLMLDAKPALADATFSVTRTTDFNDPDPGDGECGFFSARGGRACSLRAAIQQANASSGPDTIKFAIPDDPNVPGNEVKTVSPTSALPEITEAVTIDGYTQTGATKNTNAQGAINASPKIELDGSNAGLANGLALRADNVVVRGLVINRFNDVGIDIRDSANDSEPTGVKIEGNFIGTDAAGQADLGNGFEGVLLNAGMNNIIGGTTPEARNLISANEDDGVELGSGARSNKLEGNLIGTKKDGTSALGNGVGEFKNDGVDIFDSNNTIGGATPGAANTIAFNGTDGVRVSQPDTTGNRILRNSIFSNGDLGIDLHDDGRTDNDPKDPDTGANNQQNFPVLSSVKTSGGKTTINGELDSTPSKTFTLRFFANPLGEDEGKKFLGQKSVTTGSGGKVSFTFTPSQAVPGGQNVTATATNGGGNTSEFSNPVAVVASL